PRAFAPAIELAVTCEVDGVQRDGAPPAFRTEAVETLHLQVRALAEWEPARSAGRKAIAGEQLMSQVLGQQKVRPALTGLALARRGEFHEHRGAPLFLVDLHQEFRLLSLRR